MTFQLKSYAYILMLVLIALVLSANSATAEDYDSNSINLGTVQSESLIEDELEASKNKANDSSKKKPASVEDESMNTSMDDISEMEGDAEPAWSLDE